MLLNSSGTNWAGFSLVDPQNGWLSFQFPVQTFTPHTQLGSYQLQTNWYHKTSVPKSCVYQRNSVPSKTRPLVTMRDPAKGGSLCSPCSEGVPAPQTEHIHLVSFSFSNSQLSWFLSSYRCLSQKAIFLRPSMGIGCLGRPFSWCFWLAVSF